MWGEESEFYLEIRLISKETLKPVDQIEMETNELEYRADEIEQMIIDNEEEI